MVTPFGLIQMVSQILQPFCKDLELLELVGTHIRVEFVLKTLLMAWELFAISTIVTAVTMLLEHIQHQPEMSISSSID